MSLISSAFLSAIDSIRSIPARLGLHPWTISQYRKVYSRDEVLGRVNGTVSIETPLTVDGYAPHVQLVNPHDIIASAELYKTGDYRIGPLTPGNTSLTDLDPALGVEDTEVLFKLTGPGLRSGGELFRKVRTEVWSPTKYFVIVRRAGIKL